MEEYAALTQHPLFAKFEKDFSEIKLGNPRVDSFMQVRAKISDLKEFSDRYNKKVPGCSGEHHYKECAWSNPAATEGPDNCACYLSSYYYATIVEALEELYGQPK